MHCEARSWTTPRDNELGLAPLTNAAGLSVHVLPNACLFAIEHRSAAGTILVNQILGSPIDGGPSRLVLRIRGADPRSFEIVGPRALVEFAAAPDRLVWQGETHGLRHRVTLALQPNDAAWLWHVHVADTRSRDLTIDAVLIQDIGLGERGFLMNNEAYASQYIDHHIARHERYGAVVQNRQNQAQNGRHPWVAQGCLEGASGFATDGLQIFGAAHRAGERPAYETGADLPSEKLQHEFACVAIQSTSVVLGPAAQTTWRFFGLFDPDHAAASSDADLARLDAIEWQDLVDREVEMVAPARSLVQQAAVVAALPLEADALARVYPERIQEEHRSGRLLSFFVPDPPHNRHVVLADKERLVTRRHGALLRSGEAMLPDDETLCATCWMQGIFAAQLTIGNTSFHKLLTVSRDPYGITRASGLRILIDTGDGWRLLAVPSAFEIGLSDCRWIYRLDGRTVVVTAIAAGSDSAMQWRVSVEGEACRFLAYGHLVLGERELDHASPVEVATDPGSFRFRPDPGWLWAERYPEATYRLVTATPDAVETIGGDELLTPDGRPCGGAYFALRTAPTREFCFAVSGSMTDAGAAERLAAKYRAGVADRDLLAPAKAYWTRVTRGLRIRGGGREGAALDTLFPWLVQNAMIHLTVPHGLEQYTGAAWGTRDVCQGPVELLLTLEHDAQVADILRIVLSQQDEMRGDWPQWFMLEPYAAIRDKTSHGDVIVWPLKAVNDYIEATNDLGFLDELVAWRCEDTAERTSHQASVAAHMDKLLATVRARFVPGTHLVRYGEGDWNDSLQPADPELRDKMVSSWTVALLYQQLCRYAEVLRRAGRGGAAAAITELADVMRRDFNRYLLRDGTVAGYGVFDGDHAEPELLIHPCDTRTGLHYSLLPMTRSIIAGLFTPDQAQHHLRLIREHLLFPDGVRLLDRPIAYRGGLQTIFKRAESAAYFGREIGLMYVHAHLRYAEAMGALGEVDALFEALRLADPVTLTDSLPQARPRQRNTYFTSSDAAFPDRAAASAEWSGLAAGRVEVEGGWRVYSSGPGLFVNMLVRILNGRRRAWGERILRPLLPVSAADLRVEFDTEASVLAQAARHPACESRSTPYI